jgi:hypothetical protein
MDTRVKLTLSIGLGLLVLGSGVYLAYSTFTQQSGADTEVEATVLASEVEPVGRFDDDYRLSIRYTYSYDGTRYNSTNIYPGASDRQFDDEGPARETAERFAVGTNVTAYVNPDDPPESHLIEADTGGTVLGSVVLVVLGLLVLFLFGGSSLYEYLRPEPDEVSPNRHELRTQFEEAFERIDDYPIEDAHDLRFGSIDPSTKFESNDFEMTVRDVDSIVVSDPDPPCENAQQLADYLIEEMDKQGYFY